MAKGLNFRCSEEHRAKIDQLARKAGRARSETIREACRIYSEMQIEGVYECRPDTFEILQNLLPDCEV